MGKLFVKSNPNATPKEALENKYASARSSLLWVMIFTIVNVVLLFLNGDSYFVFSLFVPYMLVLLGMLYTGRLPADWYEGDVSDLEFVGDQLLYIFLAIAIVIVALYLLCWIFSKKGKIAWLVFALVMISIDTILMVLLQGIYADTLIDLVFHIWVVASLVMGIIAHNKLKKMPPEEAFVSEEAQPEVSESAPESQDK